MNRARASLFLIGVIAASVAPASAFAARTRITVLGFKGQMAARAHDAVIDAIDAAGGYEVVSEKEVKRTAESLGADLSSPKGRAAVGRELELSAYVDGSVRKHGAKIEVKLTAYSGESGDALGTGSVSAKKPALQRALRDRAMDELGPLLSQAGTAVAAVTPAPEPTPEPEAEPEPEPVHKAEPEPEAEKPEHVRRDDVDSTAEPEPEAEEPEDNGEKPKAFEFDLGLRMWSRSFEYNDAPRELPQQSNKVTPTAALALRWYPGAHFSDGAGAHIGLEASGQITYPIDSTRGADSFRTSGHAFGVGLHGRAPLGKHELGLSVGYGQHVVEIADSDSGVDPGVPSVKYGFLRAGLDARFQLASVLGLRVGAAYRLLLGYGELGDDAWFRRVSGAAIEAELALRYTVAGPFALEAIGGIWRYGLSLKPEPTDDSVTDFARIAGGVTDQSLYGGLAAVLVL
jgi:hypothetical protein